VLQNVRGLTNKWTDSEINILKNGEEERVTNL
jgi:hypothetical protein